MNQLIKYSVIALIISIVTLSHAQTTTTITDADVKLFITSFNPIKKDMEALGHKYENIQDPSALQAIGASEEVKSIFEKHGWNNNYMLKFSTIISAFAFVHMEKEMQKLPAEQQQYVAQMIQTQKTQVGLVASEDAIEVINKNYSELAAIIVEE